MSSALLQMIRSVTRADEPRLLRLASPPMTGPDVKALQDRLTVLGFPVGNVDAVFGPALETAVRAFQRAANLQEDGVVGPATRGRLDHPPSFPTPSLILGSGPGQQALRIARSCISIKEDPAGSNRTAFGKWFGSNGCPWCNIFISYCFVKGANYFICNGFQGPGVTDLGCAWVPSTLAWLQTRGMWIGHAAPLPGDLVIYDFGHGPHHIGLVEAAADGGSFWAVEGNTAVGNDANGGEVMRRQRYLSSTVGFGRVI